VEGKVGASSVTVVCACSVRTGGAGEVGIGTQEGGGENGRWRQGKNGQVSKDEPPGETGEENIYS